MPEAPDTVFVLATSQHMMMKLSWEIAALEEALASDDLHRMHDRAYIAYNSAVTAWHLTDWVWSEASPELRRNMLSKFKAIGSQKRHFQMALAKDCRELQICRQIANGSKHKVLETPDPTVRADVEWHIERARAGVFRPGDPLVKYGYQLFVIDQSTRRPALDVFHEVERYWRGLLASLGLMEDEFITGEETA
jgi:hypothetical protein